MPQYLRPDSDGDIQGLWTPTSQRWDELDQQSGSVVSHDLAEEPGATLEVGLEDGSDPGGGGLHRFTVEFKGEYEDENPEETLEVKVELVKGSTVIASILVEDPSEQYTARSVDLSPSQISQLDDYSGLDVVVTATTAPSGGPD